MSNNATAIGIGALVGVAGRILAYGEPVTWRTVSIGIGQVTIAASVGALLVHFWGVFDGATDLVIGATAASAGWLTDRAANLVRFGKLNIKAGPLEIKDSDT